MDKRVFTDKIGLSAALTQKLFRIINQYTILYRKIRLKELDNSSILQDDDWNNCWQNIIEFYYFIENTYMDRLNDMKIPGMKQEEIKEKYLEIINKFTIPSSISTISDLDFAFKCTRYIASKVGIMDINISQGNEDLSAYDFDPDMDFSWLEKEDEEYAD